MKQYLLVLAQCIPCLLKLSVFSVNTQTTQALTQIKVLVKLIVNLVVKAILAEVQKQQFPLLDKNVHLVFGAQI